MRHGAVSVQYLHSKTELRKKYTCFFFCGARPQVGIIEVSRSHTIRHIDTHPVDSSERVISSSQRPLPTKHTTNTRDENPCLQWNLKPRSQQSSGLSITPQNERTPGSAVNMFSKVLNNTGYNSQHKVLNKRTGQSVCDFIENTVIIVHYCKQCKMRLV
jgi:hypothetical protein